MKKGAIIVLVVVGAMLSSCTMSRITYEAGVQKDIVAGILLDEEAKFIHLLQIDNKNVNTFTSVRDLILFKPGKRLITFVYADGESLARPINVSYDFAENRLYGVKYQIAESGDPAINEQEYVKIYNNQNVVGFLTKQSDRYIKVSLYAKQDSTLANAIMEYSKEKAYSKDKESGKEKERGKEK